MPTHSGPNIAGESNLVFKYDTGDVKNSYRGEPTANVLLNTNLDTGWAKDYHYDIIIGDTYPKPPGITSQAVSFKTANSYGYWYSYGDYAPQADNTTYSISIWARTVGNTFYIQPYTADNGESHRVWMSSQAVIGNGEWQRLTWDNAYTTPSGNDSDSLSFYFPSAPIDQRCWLLAPQLEAKLHVTPFIEGTRSVTQGLLPLIGNSTIDLSNVSFDSSAKMVFDGTNDYVNLGSYLHNIDTSILSIELVFKTNVVTGDSKVLLGWHENEYPHGYICLGNFTGYWGNETISFYNEGPGTTALSFAYTNGHSLLSDTLYHHVVFILQTNNYKIYIDGVEVTVNASFRNGSQSTVMPSNLFGYGTTPSVVLGAGSDPAGGFFNGNIPITKIYNRALTAQEVKQNYQQYKTRFNLS